MSTKHPWNWYIQRLVLLYIDLTFHLTCLIGNASDTLQPPKPSVSIATDPFVILYIHCSPVRLQTILTSHNALNFQCDSIHRQGCVTINFYDFWSSLFFQIFCYYFAVSTCTFFCWRCCTRMRSINLLDSGINFEINSTTDEVPNIL